MWNSKYKLIKNKTKGGGILSLFLLMERDITVGPIYQTENLNALYSAVYPCRSLWTDNLTLWWDQRKVSTLGEMKWNLRGFSCYGRLSYNKWSELLIDLRLLLKVCFPYFSQSVPKYKESYPALATESKTVAVFWCTDSKLIAFTAYKGGELFTPHFHFGYWVCVELI